MNQISKLSSQLALSGLNSASAATQAQTTSGPSFASALQDGIKGFDHNIKQADQAVQQFATGQGGRTIPEVIIALERADLSLKFVTQVRNKVVDAYSEIMRMSV